MYVSFHMLFKLGILSHNAEHVAAFRFNYIYLTGVWKKIPVTNRSKVVTTNKENYQKHANKLESCSSLTMNSN